MAIKIVQRPADLEGPLTLPAQIEVVQILSSTKSSEPVTIEYRLPDESGLRFDGGGGTTRRTETIARADTSLRHQVRVSRASGTGTLRVTVDEQILDPAGEVLQLTSFDLFVQ